MNDTVTDRLKKLIEHRGVKLCQDAQVTNNLLSDYCSQHSAEIRSLVAAIELGIPNEMLNIGPASLTLRMRQWSQRIHREAGIDGRVADWTVQSWLTALGKGRPGRQQTMVSPKRNLAKAEKYLKALNIPSAIEIWQRIVAKGEINWSLRIELEKKIERASTVRKLWIDAERCSRNRDYPAARRHWQSIVSVGFHPSITSKALKETKRMLKVIARRRRRRVGLIVVFVCLVCFFVVYLYIPSHYLNDLEMYLGDLLTVVGEVFAGFADSVRQFVE